MNKQNLGLGLAVVAIILAIVGLFTPQGKSVLGQITDTSFFDIFDATTSFKINGTAVLTSSSGTGYIATTCNFLASETNTAQPATSTATYDCAVSGVTSSYKVLAGFATSTALGIDRGVNFIGAGGGVGWQIAGVKASSTAGYVSVSINNWTGASNVISAAQFGAVASNTNIWAFK